MTDLEFKLAIQQAKIDLEKFEQYLQDKTINANIKTKTIKNYAKENNIIHDLRPKNYNDFVDILKASSYMRQRFTFINVAGDSRNLPFLKFLEKEGNILLTKVDIEAAKQPNYKEKLEDDFFEMRKIQSRINGRTGADRFFLNTECMRRTSKYFDALELVKFNLQAHMPIKIALYDIEIDPKLFENVYIISWKQFIYLFPSRTDTIPQGLAQLYVNYLGDRRDTGFEFLNQCLFIDQLTRFKYPHFFIVYDETSKCFLTLDKALKNPDFIESYIYAINWWTHENGIPKFATAGDDHEMFFGACTLGNKQIDILERQMFTISIDVKDAILTGRMLKAKLDRQRQEKEAKMTETEKEERKKREKQHLRVSDEIMMINFRHTQR